MTNAQSRHDLFEHARRRAELTVRQLWLRYIALTGSCDVFELDAFLNGVAPLPAHQQDVLAHALNERLEELYRAARVPYLAADLAVPVHEDPLIALEQLSAPPEQAADFPDRETR